MNLFDNLQTEQIDTIFLKTNQEKFINLNSNFKNSNLDLNFNELNYNPDNNLINPDDYNKNNCNLNYINSENIKGSETPNFKIISDKVNSKNIKRNSFKNIVSSNLMNQKNFNIFSFSSNSQKENFFNKNPVENNPKNEIELNNTDFLRYYSFKNNLKLTFNYEDKNNILKNINPKENNSSKNDDIQYEENNKTENLLNNFSYYIENEKNLPGLIETGNFDLKKSNYLNDSITDKFEFSNIIQNSIDNSNIFLSPDMKRIFNEKEKNNKQRIKDLENDISLNLDKNKSEEIILLKKMNFEKTEENKKESNSIKKRIKTEADVEFSIGNLEEEKVRIFLNIIF